MKALQKVALSLLIAVVALSLFAVLAYSGLFKRIQSTFYDARQTAVVQAELRGAVEAIDDYHQRNMTAFASVAEDPSVKQIYSPNQSADDIRSRFDLFGKLRSDLPGFLYARFIDETGSIHYSTLDSDVVSTTSSQREYKTLSAADNTVPVDQLALAESDSGKLLIDGNGQRFIYRLPASDTLGQRRGTVLFYVSVSDLDNYLVHREVLEPGRPLAAVADRGITIGASPDRDAKLLLAVVSEWNAGGALESGRPVVSNGAGDQLYLFSATSKLGGEVGLLAPASQFTLDPTLQALLLCAIFATAFLVAFLALNLRQDRMVILSARVKHFQISFLKDYLESSQTVDWQRRYRELELRGNEVKREIKRGVGRLTTEREALIDRLIDKSWEDILSVIGKRVEIDAARPVDLRGLEETMRRVLASVELKAVPGAALPPPRPVRPAPATEEAVEELEEFESDAPAKGSIGGSNVADPEDLEALEESEHSGVDAAPRPGASGDDLEPDVLEEVEELQSEAESDRPPARQAELLTPADGEAEELEEVEALEDGSAAEPPVAEPAPSPGVVEGSSTRAPAAETAETLDELEELEAEEAVAAPGHSSTSLDPTSRSVTDHSESDASEDGVELLSPIAEDEEPLGATANEPSVAPHESPEDAPLFNWNALDDVDALDLEALFHGEELLADIDIFDERLEEALPADEEQGELEEIAEYDSPVHLVGNAAIEDGIPELIGVAVDGSAELGSAKSAFSIYASAQLPSRRVPAGHLESAGGRGSDEDAAELIEVTDRASIAPPISPGPAMPEPELEELGEAEELGELPTRPPEFGGPAIAEESANQPVTGDFNAGLAALVERKRIEIFDLTATQPEGGPRVVEAAEGVLEVERAPSFLSDRPAGNEAFQNLVDAVVSVERTDKPITAIAALGANGYDYDRFRARFKVGPIGTMKSLMRISQAADAIYAALLLPGDRKITAEYTLGLEQRTAATLAFEEGDPVFEQLLRPRKIVYLRSAMTGITHFDRKVSARDLRFMRASLYLPILFEATPAYLFFGLKDAAASVEEILARLATA